MILDSYDYIAIGLAIVAVLLVVQQRKSGLTHIIMGSYLLVMVALGLYRCMDERIGTLLYSPNQTGLFLITYKSLAGFLITAKVWIVGLVTGFLGRQILLGSTLGSLSSKTVAYRIRDALQPILAALSIRFVGMTIRIGPLLFTKNISYRSTQFINPYIREIIHYLPGIIAAHIILTILATTIFSLPLNISFKIKTKGRSKDAIYMEREEEIRHVVE